MSDHSIELAYRFEDELSKLPQDDAAKALTAQVKVDNILHGGMYARTLVVPAGVAVAGALIKISTLLIVRGHAVVYVGDKSVEVKGYHIFAASPHRKQALLAIEDTQCTMIFPSNAKTVFDAENEFTDEADKLFTRFLDNEVTDLITGE
jgi:hypothetical protein